MVSIDGTEISGATIDGTPVKKITVDGDVVWRAFSEIENFESGMGDWFVEHGSGNYGTVQSPRVEGSFAGSTTVTDEGLDLRKNFSERTGSIQFYIRMGADTGDDRDEVRIGLSDPDTGDFGADGMVLRFEDGTRNIVEINNTADSGGTWSPNTWYKIEWVPDWSNHTFDIYIDNNLAISGSMTDSQTSFTSVKQFEITNQTFFSAQTRSVYVDYIK